MKYLDLYKRWVEDGYMLCPGLCTAFGGDTIFGVMCPTSADILELKYEGCTTMYWGSDDWSNKIYEFTELRQTIVLFMAALNDEL